MIKRLDALYAWFSNVASFLQSPFLLIIRLAWGVQFLQTGWGKLTNIPKVVENFTSMGAPAPAVTAPFIATLEAVGGVLLILGLASRLISLPLTINMIAAYVIADREALQSIFSDSDKFFAAAPYTFLFASLIVLIFGPGQISLDHLINKWYRAKQQPLVAAVR